MIQHSSQRSLIARVAVLPLAVVIVVSATMGATPASAAPATSHRVVVVHGTAVGAPLVITNIQPTDDPTTFTFDVTGGETWSGDLSGTTTYQGHGALDLTTNEATITLHETFTGTVKGLGTGRLELFDILTNGPDNLGSVLAFVTGGAGGLSDVHGLLGFQVTRMVDPDENGNGTSYSSYLGALVR